MDATYKIVGGDGKEYGPVSLTEIRTWIDEGRIAADTRLWRSDLNAWRPASGFPELGLGSKGPTPAPSTATASAHVLGTAGATLIENQLKSGASWFYWIAGLSLFNSLAPRFGLGWGFVVGLGLTQEIDHLARQMGPDARTTALVLDGLAAGLFALFGWLGQKRQAWAYIIGMVLYTLDALLLLPRADWFSIAFHLFALYCLLGGYRALRKLKAAAWR